MVSWVEEVLGHKDGGKKTNSELWQADNALWHQLGVLFEGHSVPWELRQMKSNQFTVQGTCVLKPPKAEIPAWQEWQRQRDAKYTTVPAETVAGKEAWNDLHILSICYILKHKLISHIHKHTHLTLKSRNLGHLEICVYTFYLDRIWKEEERKKKNAADALLRMCEPAHSHDWALC